MGRPMARSSHCTSQDGSNGSAPAAPECLGVATLPLLPRALAEEAARCWATMLQERVRGCRWDGVGAGRSAGTVHSCSHPHPCTAAHARPPVNESQQWVAAEGQVEAGCSRGGGGGGHRRSQGPGGRA